MSSSGPYAGSRSDPPTTRSCQEVLEHYLEARRATVNRVTLRGYRRCVGSLVEFLRVHYPEVPSFGGLRRVPHIEGWLRDLRADPRYTESTRRQLLFEVRRFLRDILQWGWAKGLSSGLIRRDDFPPQERSLSPRRQRKRLAAELGIPPERLPADPWFEVVERYLRAISVTNRGNSGDGYRAALLCLIKFLRRRFPELHFPRELRSSHIESWLKWLREKEPPYEDSTRQLYIWRVRRFLADIDQWEWPESPAPGLIPRRERSRWRRYLEITSRVDTPFGGTIQRYLEIRSGTLRPATLSHYRVALQSLAELLCTRYPEVESFAAVRRSPHIEDWLRMLAEVRPPYTSDARREMIRDLRRFFEDIEEWGWPESPVSELIFRGDFPPPEHHLPRPLAPEVDHRLMDALRENGDIVSLGLMLKRRTGLRIGELLRLELGCVVEDPNGHSSLSVPLGKLRNERVIPIDPEIVELVKTIRRMRGDRPATPECETGRALQLLFVGPGAESFRYQRFARKLQRVARSAGIAERVHLHRLRHTYATELLRAGVSLVGVMKLLGHKTLRMTLRYVEVTNEDLGREYLRAIEQARHRYCELKEGRRAEMGEGSDPLDAITVVFDDLVARLQKIHFDRADSALRKRLQRLIERLRRAQSDVPRLLE